MTTASRISLKCERLKAFSKHSLILTHFSRVRSKAFSPSHTRLQSLDISPSFPYKVSCLVVICLILWPYFGLPGTRLVPPIDILSDDPLGKPDQLPSVLLQFATQTVIFRF
jgi:hypothetical protein